MTRLILKVMTVIMGRLFKVQKCTLVITLRRTTTYEEKNHLVKYYMRMKTLLYTACHTFNLPMLD